MPRTNIVNNDPDELFNRVIKSYFANPRKYVDEHFREGCDLLNKFENPQLPEDYYCYILLGPIPIKKDLSVEDIIRCAFYVGKGRGDRLDNHLTNARDVYFGKKTKVKDDNEVYEQMAAIWKFHKMVTIIKIDFNLTYAKALCYEAALISAIGRESHNSGPLKNAKDGDWDLVIAGNSTLSNLTLLQKKKYGIYILAQNIKEALKTKVEYAQPIEKKHIPQRFGLSLTEAIDKFKTVFSHDSKAVAVFGHSDSVTAFNDNTEKIWNKLLGRSCDLKAIYNKEALQTLQMLAAPNGGTQLPSNIIVRTGCRVMITHNLSKTLIEGTIGILHDYSSPDKIVVRFEPDKDTTIERILCEDEHNTPCQQYPIKVLFARNWYESSIKDSISEEFLNSNIWRGYIESSSVRLSNDLFESGTWNVNIERNKQVEHELFICCANNVGSSDGSSDGNNATAIHLLLDKNTNFGFCNAFVQLIKASTIREQLSTVTDHAIVNELNRLFIQTNANSETLEKLLSKKKNGVYKGNDPDCVGQFAEHFLHSLPSHISDQFVSKLLPAYTCIKCKKVQIIGCELPGYEEPKEISVLRVGFPITKENFIALKYVDYQTFNLAMKCGSCDVVENREKILDAYIPQNCASLLVVLPKWTGEAKTRPKIASPLTGDFEFYGRTWRRVGAIQHSKNVKGKSKGTSYYTAWVKSQSSSSWTKYIDDKKEESVVKFQENMTDICMVWLDRVD